ncbi:MAG: hypothetical protein ACREC5_08720, partial [Thermoplasmata archaeon]
LTLVGGDTPWRRRFASRMLLAADRILPLRSLLGPVVDRIHGGARGERLAHFVAGDASFEAMAPRIDWQRTLAYSYPVPEAIYLNPYGPKLSEEGRAELLQRLKAELSAFPEAHVEVFEPREIYRGVHHPQAPALLFRINRLETDSRMDFTYPKPMMHERPGYFYGSGVHRMEGIFLASGAGVSARGRSPEPFSLLDIAPTVLEGMGVPVPGAIGGLSRLPRLGAAAP